MSKLSESFEVDGREMYKQACKTGLEGVASKVRDSRYPTGRSNDWVKKACAQRETLTIAGFALDGSKFDGIYLGRRKGKKLVYAGKVDHGFDKASAKDLQARLKPLIRKTQPFNKRIEHRGFLPRQSLDGLHRVRRAAPSEKFEFFIFKRIGSFEKFLQLLDSPCWKSPHVLQIAFKRRAVGHRKKTVVPLFLTLVDLKNFEHSDRFAAEN